MNAKDADAGARPEDEKRRDYANQHAGRYRACCDVANDRCVAMAAVTYRSLLGEQAREQNRQRRKRRQYIVVALGTRDREEQYDRERHRKLEKKGLAKLDGEFSTRERDRKRHGEEAQRQRAAEEPHHDVVNGTRGLARATHRGGHEVAEIFVDEHSRQAAASAGDERRYIPEQRDSDGQRENFPRPPAAHERDRIRSNQEQVDERGECQQDDRDRSLGENCETHDKSRSERAAPLSGPVELRTQEAIGAPQKQRHQHVGEYVGGP